MFWAGARAGIATSIINPAMSPKDLSHLINNGRAKAMFFGQNYQSLVESLRSQFDSVREFITLGPSEGNFKGYEGLISSYPSKEAFLPIQHNASYDVANRTVLCSALAIAVLDTNLNTILIFRCYRNFI